MIQLTIAQIRSYSTALPDSFIYTTDIGKEGVWRITTAPSPASDNLGTVLKTMYGEYIQRITENEINVNWFGAVSDFDPSTGVGTDNQPPIQAAIAAAIYYGTNTVVIPPGRYYIGSYAEPSTGAQIIIGSTSACDPCSSEEPCPGYSVNNLEIRGRGAELYGGQGGRVIVVANAYDVKITGIKMFGNTASPSPDRENDALIAICYKSKSILIDDVYLTNSLGDCIFLGGDLSQTGGGIGSTVQNIKIVNSVLKKRIGNNVASSDKSGTGTKGREAIAACDVSHLEVSNNSIYGSIDLEPNLNNQYITGVSIQNNLFLKGNVVAQDPVGTSYWIDELVCPEGDGVISNDIKLQGIPGSPIVKNNSVRNNTIENGVIVTSYMYGWDVVSANAFDTGQIVITGDNTAGRLNNSLFTNNVAQNLPSGQNAFIAINGQLKDCFFVNNLVYQANAYCIGIGTPVLGPPFDTASVYINNLALNSTAPYYGSFDSNTFVSNDFNTTRQMIGSQTVSDRIAVGSPLQPYNNFEIFRNGGPGYNFSNNGLTTASVMQLQSGTAAGSNWIFLGAYAAGTNVFTVLGNGNVINTNNSYGAISDAKLKENIAQSRGYLNDILKLNVKKFSLKSENSEEATQLGLIAQEVEKVFPGIVDTIEDVGLDGHPLGTTTKSIKYSVFIPMLIKCVQELNDKVENLSS